MVIAFPSRGKVVKLIKLGPSATTSPSRCELRARAKTNLNSSSPPPLLSLSLSLSLVSASSLVLILTKMSSSLSRDLIRVDCKIKALKGEGWGERGSVCLRSGSEP